MSAEDSSINTKKEIRQGPFQKTLREADTLAREIYPGIWNNGVAYFGWCSLIIDDHPEREDTLRFYEEFIQWDKKNINILRRNYIRKYCLERSHTNTLSDRPAFKQEEIPLFIYSTYDPKIIRDHFHWEAITMMKLYPKYKEYPIFARFRSIWPNIDVGEVVTRAERWYTTPNELLPLTCSSCGKIHRDNLPQTPLSLSITKITSQRWQDCLHPDSYQNDEVQDDKIMDNISHS